MTQFKKLVLLLNPNKNHFPFSRDAYNRVLDAFDVLRRTQFQNELEHDAGASTEDDVGPPRDDEEKTGKVETFWTVCPYCYCLYEYEGCYRECSLKCQNQKCSRAFHGVEVAAPVPGMVVEGKEQYYCGIGCFGLRYWLGVKKEESKEHVLFSDDSGHKKNGFLDDNRGANGNKGLKVKGGLKKENVVVLISDDSDDYDDIRNKDQNEEKHEGVFGNVKVSEFGVGGGQDKEKFEVGISGKRATRRVKTTARNTKKIFGRGIKITSMADLDILGVDIGGNPEPDGAEAATARGDLNELESDDGNLEFFFGEDDVYIGLKD